MTAFAQLHDGDGTGLVRQPGLDGLRGVAVAAVVAFHLGIDEVSGGYLGVSLFFTLSGVLVGSLVIAMLDRRAFSVREFGLRRARRLLPAALTTVAAVGVARLLFEQFSGTPGIDVAAAALDVINWRFVAADVSYAELFAAPSALLHFWSLAIEAQLYLVVAALAVGAALAGTPRRVIGWGALVGTVLSFVMTPLMAAWRGWSIDRIYYGTDTRAGELLAGLALAVLVADGERRRRLLAGERPVALLGALAAVATFVLWSAATPTSAALRFGLLPLTTAFSLALIVAALLPADRWPPRCAGLRCVISGRSVTRCTWSTGRFSWWSTRSSATSRCAGCPGWRSQSCSPSSSPSRSSAPYGSASSRRGCSLVPAWHSRSPSS